VVGVMLAALPIIMFMYFDAIRNDPNDSTIKANEREFLGKSFEDGRRIDLSRSENGFLKNSFKSNGQMRVMNTMRMKGPRISLKLVNRQLELLQDKHPVLRCRVMKDSSHKYKYQLVQDSTMDLVAEAFRVPELGIESWQQVWKQEGSMPMVEGHLALRVLIITYEDTDNVCDIMVMMEHAFCDGISLSLFCHELLCLVSGDPERMPSMKPLPWQAPLEVLSARGNDQWIKETLSWSKAQMKSLMSTRLKKRGSNKQNISKLLQVFDDYDTKTLVLHCKKNNTSVTAAVSTAVADAIAYVCDSKQSDKYVVMQLAADLRRQYNDTIDDAHLFCHAGAIGACAVNTNGDLSAEGLWKAARTLRSDVVASMGQVRGGSQLLGVVYSSEDFINDYVRQAPSCSLTSWGVLPFRSHYGKWTLTMQRPCVNIINSYYLMVICSTVNETTTLSFVASSEFSDEHVLKSLAKQTRKRIMKMFSN